MMCIPGTSLFLFLFVFRMSSNRRLLSCNSRTYPPNKTVHCAHFLQHCMSQTDRCNRCTGCIRSFADRCGRPFHSCLRSKHPADSVPLLLLEFHTFSSYLFPFPYVCFFMIVNSAFPVTLILVAETSPSSALISNVAILLPSFSLISAHFEIS